MQSQTICSRCGSANSPTARYCQQCGNSMLGPAGAKGTPAQQSMGPQSGDAPAQTPSGSTNPPAWGQTALSGLAGFVLGSLFGGGRGLFGGWGGGRDWDGDGGWSGGDWGGGDVGGGGDSGG